MLPLSMMSGTGMAQTAIMIANLPPVKIATKADYRLKDLTEHRDTLPRKTPMLERLFTPLSGFSASDHRHSASFAIGGIEMTAEAMRDSMLNANGGPERKGRVVDRLWAGGVHADWAAGANDNLSLGIAADRDKRAEPAILPGRTHIKGSAIDTELAWTHDDHLRISLGWRADRSTSHSQGAERLVEIAQGAALREQGVHMTLSYMLEGADSTRGAAFGIAARSAQVAADDLAMIGSAYRRDVQAALFFKALF